jgi:hypothetical protein
MATLRITTLTALSAVAAAAGLLAGTLVAAPVASARPGEAPSAPCYNGITPLDPYADICSIPHRPPRVLGSAPDQTALLNCSVGSEVLRAQCLSQFVNGGFGGFPGAVLGRGLRP